MKKRFFKDFVIFVSALILFTNSIFGMTLINDNDLTTLTSILDLDVKSMTTIFNDDYYKTIDTNSRVKIAINSNKKNLQITLKYNEKEYECLLCGEYETIITKDNVGFVGVYEGEIDALDGLELELTENGKLPIIADVTFGRESVIVNLTIGYTSETKKPIILLYGKRDRMINDILNEYYLKVSKTSKDTTSISSNITQYSVLNSADERISYKGTKNIMASSCVAGVMSVYHNNQLGNGHVGTVFVKVNTNTENFRKYLLTTIGFNYLEPTVYQDQFTISICGNHSELASIIGSYNPAANVKTSQLTLPFVLPDGSYGTTGISYVSSSTKITNSSYGSNGNPYNQVKWVMSKLSGWSLREFDGDRYSQTGMVVSSNFVNSGYITSNVSRSFTCKASIRYMYFVTNENGIMETLHQTTSTASITTNITITP